MHEKRQFFARFSHNGSDELRMEKRRDIRVFGKSQQSLILGASWSLDMEALVSPRSLDLTSRQQSDVHSTMAIFNLLVCMK